MLTDLAVFVIRSRGRKTSVITKLLEDMLQSDELDQDHIMVLLMLQLDGEVARRIHLQMLLRIDGWEVNSIHKMVQVRFPEGEVLAGQLTILHLWIKGLGISGSSSDLAVSLPVENSANEV